MEPARTGMEGALATAIQRGLETGEARWTTKPNPSPNNDEKISGLSRSTESAAPTTSTCEKPLPEKPLGKPVSEARVVQFLAQPCEHCGADPEYAERGGILLPVPHECAEKREFLQRQFEWELLNPSVAVVDYWVQALKLSPILVKGENGNRGGLSRLDVDEYNREAIAACQEMLRDFQNGKRDGWLYIYSPELGTGKTTLSQTLALDIARLTGPYWREGASRPQAVWGKKVIPYWWDIPTLFRDWKRSFSGERSRYDANQLGDTDLLLLDEFGNDRSTAFNLDGIFEIVDGRYRKNKALVITANYSLTDLEWRVRELTDNNKEAMDQIDRIIARLRQRATVLRLGPKDRRTTA